MSDCPAPRFMRPLKKQDGKFLGYTFWCPGCKSPHVYYIANHEITWKFDLNFDEPTFSPSLKMRWHYGPERELRICHLFVTKGKIRYCGDCTHELAGQTVDMQEFEW